MMFAKKSTPAAVVPELSSSTTPLSCWKAFTRKQRTTPKRSFGTVGVEYRGGKVRLIQKVKDCVHKQWNGTDLRKRSKYAASRRQTPPMDFRKMLHHNIRDISKIPMASNHTHPSAASLRTTVAVKLEQIIVAAGLKPYSVSMSHRDKYDGCRYFFMQKDLDKTFRDDVVTDQHVLMMIDVDYYCDINHYLQLGNPIMIYTFVPTEAGGKALDASYTIDNNIVTYSVQGGATYHHELWDYQGDNVCVKDKFGNTIVYVIEQHVLEEDPNRRIVGFYPIATYPRYTIPFEVKRGVQRLKPTYGGVNCIKNITSSMVSVSVVGSTNAVTIPQSIYDALVVRRGESKNPVIADVERILNAEGIEKAFLKAPILFKLLSGEIGGCGTITSTTTIGQARNFQTLFPLVHEDGKSVGRSVAPPLVTEPAFVPAKSFNNDVATISGRIDKIRNDKVTPAAWKTYDAELAEFIVPKELAATGSPYTYERVMELQNKPAQRGRSEQIKSTVALECLNKVKAFIKAEPYGSITDPRNISTVDPSHQLSYSCFTLPFKEDCLKGKPWFASSMTPTELTNRVREVCQYQYGVIVSDYSRLDGHISASDKQFKEHVYQRWNSYSHRAALSRILAADRNPKGVTAQGHKYDPGFSQLSGSPGTTNDNNLVTLRHDYIALRLLGNEPEMAWQLVNQWVLGASDDRIRANLPGLAEMLELVASKLGHELKSVVLYPQQGSPVPFLGRIYASPATHLDSVQDPERTLAKLHLTMSPDTVPPKQALFNRAFGYHVTDKNTPIIGVWCAKVMELLQKEGFEWHHSTNEEDFRVRAGPYPQDNVDLLRNLMSLLLNLTADEIDQIEGVIRAATDIESLPEGIIDNGFTIRHRIKAAVGHDILGPVPTVSTETTKCPSVPIISEICANQETTGSDESSHTLDSPSPPPVIAINTSQPTADIPPVLTEPKSSGQLRSSSPPLQKIKHRAEKSNPPKLHRFEECEKPAACRYHKRKHGASKKTTTQASKKTQR